MSLIKRNMSTVFRNGDARLRFGRRPRPDDNGLVVGIESKYQCEIDILAI